MTKLSVVMAVFNGGRSLHASIDSILSQTETDFELIVVDDGSTDDTPAILRSYAESDERVRIITLPNGGLTQALIRGCSAARGEFIARHDCGDRSDPQRFAVQLALLAAGHVLVSCAVRFVDPDGDLLFIARASGDDLRNGLRSADARHIRSIPHHGSAMFRRDAYLAAGGYRREFRVAQDLDLWIRMAALGSIGVTDEILYEATVETRSITTTSRDQQMRLTQLAVALRDSGDEALLREAASVRQSHDSRRSEAAAYYFIARCLLRQHNSKGFRYLREALRRNPLHVRAWVSLIFRR